MPPDKKPKKAPSGGGDRKAMEQVILLIVLLFFLGALITAALTYFESFGLGTADSLWEKFVKSFFKNVWPIWIIVAGVVSGLSLIGIIYNIWHLRAINIAEEKIYNPSPEPIATGGESKPEPKNEKWEKVLKYLNSNNVSDWRLAVIEADVMLDETLRLAGLHGDTVGDMLKSAGKNDFSTLDEAWEAHKIRNAIAHSGTDFQLSEREAKRVAALFEKVFKEFQVI